MFVKNADCGVAGRRRSREKLIQAPLLTQNLKKFPTRCRARFAKSFQREKYKSRSNDLNAQEGLSANQGTSKDGWSFEVRKHNKKNRTSF